MIEIFNKSLEITGTLSTSFTPDGPQGGELGANLPVMKDVLGRLFIPGSSFKGAWRSRLESFLRSILDSAPHLVTNPEWSITQPTWVT